MRCDFCPILSLYRFVKVSIFSCHRFSSIPFFKKQKLKFLFADSQYPDAYNTFVSINKVTNIERLRDMYKYEEKHDALAHLDAAKALNCVCHWI